MPLLSFFILSVLISTGTAVLTMLAGAIRGARLTLNAVTTFIIVAFGMSAAWLILKLHLLPVLG